jgi:hypothetical protein
MIGESMRQMDMFRPRGVHLVGSFPLEDAQAVFRLASQELGNHLRRMPDGETGPRSHWINWQSKIFGSMPVFDSEEVDTGYIRRRKFRLRRGVRSQDIRFPPLGYAKAALESHALFARMRSCGEIAPHLRFLVCLPTPLAPVSAFTFIENFIEVEAHYETRLMAEIDEIVAAIPNERLAIQWDVAYELAILEGVMGNAFANPEAEILDRLVRIADRVPPSIELGFHFCYGDSGHRHFKEPQDAGKLVKLANQVATRLGRPLNWVHFPVPRQRVDDDYYLPLAALALRPETELYLGLVHFTDGIEGTTRRIETASRHVQNFGLATECGLGRRPSDTIAPLLDIHASLAAPVIP